MNAVDVGGISVRDTSLTANPAGVDGLIRVNPSRF